MTSERARTLAMIERCCRGQGGDVPDVPEAQARDHEMVNYIERLADEARAAGYITIVGGGGLPERIRSSRSEQRP